MRERGYILSALFTLYMGMEIITSIDNKTVKRLNKLKQKKYRDEYGEFFVEGYKNVLDTINARPELVRSIVMNESAYVEYGGEFADFETVVLSDRVFCKLAETQNSQGVISINTVQKTVFPSGMRCILLDRVRDPGNVGTILRTAVAADYSVVLNNCADAYSPKVVRSAMSAIVKCDMAIDIPPERLKSAGYEIIAADMNGENLFSARAADKYCIVIGNEANGIEDGIKELADRTISIPQNNMESLNAAVAAGIMMFGLRYAAK